MTYEREELRRPPLIEALFEVRVETAVPYAVVPGALYARLSGAYAAITEVVPSFMVFEGEAAPSLAHHRFASDDGRNLVQCGPSLLTVNVVGDYGRFEDFEARISTALDAYWKVTKPSRVTRLGLRYINLVDEDLLQGAWPFRMNVVLPDELTDERSETRLRTILGHPSGERLAIRIVTPATLPDQRKGAILDLDCFVGNPSDGTVEGCVPWARTAHDRIYQTFRAALSDEAYKRLRERS